MIARFSPLLMLMLASNGFASHPHSRDSETIYRETRQGVIKPLGAIVNGVEPDMRRRGADYIGAEYDESTLHYRLKFMRDGSVIWVDVDGRSGAVIGEAGR